MAWQEVARHAVHRNEPTRSQSNDDGPDGIALACAGAGPEVDKWTGRWSRETMRERPRLPPEAGTSGMVPGVSVEAAQRVRSRRCGFCYAVECANNGGRTSAEISSGRGRVGRAGQGMGMGATIAVQVNTQGDQGDQGDRPVAAVRA